jgi:hypothetical protein
MVDFYVASALIVQSFVWPGTPAKSSHCFVAQRVAQPCGSRISLTCAFVLHPNYIRNLIPVKDPRNNVLENSHIASGLIGDAVHAIAVDSYVGSVAVGIGSEVHVSHKVATRMPSSLPDPAYIPTSFLQAVMQRSQYCLAQMSSRLYFMGKLLRKTVFMSFPFTS